MAEFNPFASPAYGGSPFQTGAVPDLVIEEHAGLWREGSLLVMHRNARLPDRCVKSNQPAHGRLRRKLQWHHPAIYLLILVALLIYVIVAIVMTKRATIYIGLSEEWFVRRRRAIATAWLMALAGIGSFVGGIALVDQHPQAGWLILLGLVLVLAGAVWGIVKATLVTPKRITDEHIWLKGVHPDFLAELPRLPNTW